MKKFVVFLMSLVVISVMCFNPAQCQLPSSHIIVSCFLDEVMTVIDARAIRVVNTIRVNKITDMAISPDNKFLVASIFHGSYLPVYHVPSLRMGTTAQGRHLERITAMEFSPDGARLYALSQEDCALYEIHVPSFKLIRSLKLEYYSPSSMVLTKDKSKAYVVHPEMGAVSVIDLMQWKNVGDIRFKKSIGGIALNKDETKLAVISPLDRELQIYDATSIGLLGTAPVEQGACNVKITSDDVAVVVNSTSNSLSIININNPLDRRVLAVGINPQDLLLMPNGQGCYVANYTSGDISVVDLSSIRQLGRLAVGKGPRCLKWMQ